MVENLDGMQAFLKLHGPLVKMLPDGGALLTVDGRLYVSCFLAYQGLLTAKCFAEVREKWPERPGFETNRLIARIAARWLKDHELDEQQGIYEPTDMTLNSIRALLSILVVSQFNFEAALKAKE